MFNRIKLIIENNNLKTKNTQLQKENKRNREDIENFELQKYHSKQLAEKTLDYLDDLQEIDRLGISEESKKRYRNTVINEMRIKNIDIIKELISDAENQN
nr:MAG TPA: hypothetical protein [Caudoviricetes sp.]